MCNSKFNFKEIGQMSRSKGLKPTEDHISQVTLMLNTKALALTVEELHYQQG